MGEHDDCPHSVCRDCQSDIIQIIPATGWLLWYIDEQDKLYSEAMPAWALCRDGTIKAQSADAMGYVDHATDDTNFVAVRHERDGKPTDEMISEVRRKNEARRPQ